MAGIDLNQNPKPNSKFTLPNGRCVAEYVADFGYGLGFSIGNAVRLCHLAGISTDLADKKKYMDGMSWYINFAERNCHVSKDEVIEIVTKITNKIENDIRSSEMGAV